MVGNFTRRGRMTPSPSLNRTRCGKAAARYFSVWAESRVRVIALAVGALATVLYEIARAYYRPFIAASGINDFHVADTLGNSIGTVATVFTFVSLLGRDFTRAIFLIRTVTLGVLVYEVAHPLLGKRIDSWDLLATLIAGALCEVVYRWLHERTAPASSSQEINRLP